ncbi:MAG: hypothetical protein AAGF93_20680, partial [Cyanobacteria bacterium P01_H01_bin.105]
MRFSDAFISDAFTKLAKAFSILASYLTKALPKQYCPRQTAAIYVSIKSDVLLHDNGRYFFVFLKTLSSNFP